MSQPTPIPFKKLVPELLRHQMALNTFYAQQKDGGKMSDKELQRKKLYDQSIIKDIKSISDGKTPEECHHRKLAYKKFTDDLAMYKAGAERIVATGKATRTEIEFRLACLEYAKIIIQDIIYYGNFHPAAPGQQQDFLNLFPTKASVGNGSKTFLETNAKIRALDNSLQYARANSQI